MPHLLPESYPAKLGRRQIGERPRGKNTEATDTVQGFNTIENKPLFSLMRIGHFI
jgi:hypothetical protein